VTTKKSSKPQPDQRFGAGQEIVTFRYRGPNRRQNGAFDISEFLPPAQKLGDVTFDAKGNPVWQLKVDLPRRRKEDDTLDLIKCLDVDSLSLADESEGPDTGGGYDPYGFTDEKS
jgi:hypothetical protein